MRPLCATQPTWSRAPGSAFSVLHLSALGSYTSCQPTLARSMVGSDAPLAVTADDMQPSRPCGGPRHLAARQRQRGAGYPAAGCALRRRTFRDALGLFVRRDVMRRVAA